MNYLLAEKLGKSYGTRVLFSELTFGIQKGQKIALVARNGSGKTTLLNILTGKESPDSGKVVLRSGVRIGYLQQDPSFSPGATVWDAIFANESPVVHAIHQYELALEEFGKSKTEEAEKFLSAAMLDMDRHQAWDFEARVKQILSKLKIDQIDQKVSTLSGGQLKRLALASVLLNEPDLLILDEPTNHLDVEMIEWLEDFLSAPNLTVFMVTHDRYFLDNVCSDIYELDNNTIFQYNGNYEYFLTKKAEREAAMSSEADKAKNLFYRELEWVRRMPKARGTKSKSRMDAFEGIKDKAFALQKKKEIDISMRMKRMGNKILELIKVSKSYGDKNLIDHFTYSFRKGERIGIVGPNGSGKSTLIKMITGSETPDSGKIIVGETIEFGVYDQQGIRLKEDQRVIEVIRDIADIIETNSRNEEKNVRVTSSQMLQRFDFPPDMQYTPVSKLSGGEKRRLYLLTVLLKNPNFLILDEPTNDLDIVTLNKLEEFLMDFEGCLIVISHDRYFMDKLVDQIFAFEGDGQVKVFGGNYTQYRISKPNEADVKAAATPPEAIPETKTETAKTRLSYKEKLEFEKIEKLLPQLEEEKRKLTEELNKGTSDIAELNRITTRLGEVTSEIDLLTDRWLVLSEYN